MSRFRQTVYLFNYALCRSIKNLLFLVRYCQFQQVTGSTWKTYHQKEKPIFAGGTAKAWRFLLKPEF